MWPNMILIDIRYNKLFSPIPMKLACFVYLSIDSNKETYDILIKMYYLHLP